jgi:hypothetical protein
MRLFFGRIQNHAVQRGEKVTWKIELEHVNMGRAVIQSANQLLERQGYGTQRQDRYGGSEGIIPHNALVFD